VANISPGVYSKIVDLSTYVSEVPSSIGLFCCLTKRGEDNKIKFIGSRAELISEIGQPNINDYGKDFSQGPYFAYNFLGESGSIYFMRCLPEDAQYANIMLSILFESEDTTASISVSHIDSLNSKREIITALEDSTSDVPLCIFYPIGRGEDYNKVSIRMTKHSNPLYPGIYILDVYEKQSDGNIVIIESFEVSFNRDAMDFAGDSIFIENILERYSSILRCKVGEAGYALAGRVYDNEMGTVSVVLESSDATITDSKQNFKDWETASETGNANYQIVARDARGNVIYGWLGAADENFETVNVFDSRDLDSATQAWAGNVEDFDDDSIITYEIKKVDVDISSAFVSSIPRSLKLGTDGSLMTPSGGLNTEEAISVLSKAYAGILFDPHWSDTDDKLVDEIFDVELYEFNLVYDGGYPTAVKNQIVNLVQTRRDCIAILDNGDNTNFNNAISERLNSHTYNNFYTILYEGYNKIYDPFTGQEVWFSPLYHASYLIPRNDRVADIWWAPAGLNRAIIEGISDIRFNPKQGQRDQLYLKQLNPVVKFSGIGHTIWGQLMSQTRPTPLQDLNIVRLYLMINKALSQFCKYYIFEMNDEITWSKVHNQIVEFLENVKTKRGLYFYDVSVYATEYQKKRKTFSVDVTLEPTRTVEKIELNFSIQ